MELLFLGTSCTQPTKERNHPSVLLEYKGENIIFDCGEGTQRQLKFAGIKASKITKLLITHWHGDHVLGIPGLIQTMGMSSYSKKLLIFGPKGSKEHMQFMLKAFESKGSVEFEVKDIDEELFFECEDYYLESFTLEHSTPAIGFRFVEKSKRRIDVKKITKLGIPEGPLLGKLQQGEDIIWKSEKVKADDVTFLIPGRILGYIGDTKMCSGCTKIAKDADLLISEATFLEKDREKAEDRFHLTAKEAGLIASSSNAKKLALMHFSLRYKEVGDLREEAKLHFDNVICADDFTKIKM